MLAHRTFLGELGEKAIWYDFIVRTSDNDASLTPR